MIGIINRLYKSAIGKNLFANFYGIGVGFFAQIILVPFYLTYWGVDKYADWIVLTAISSFFSMSDIGLNTVTSNSFSIKLAEGNDKECTALLTNNFIFLSITTCIAVVGAIIFSYYADLVKVLGLTVTTSRTARYVFVLLIIQIFIGMFSGVMNAVYRSKSLASKATYLDTTARLLEAIILLFGLLLKLSLELIVTVYLVPRIIIMVYKHFDIQKLFLFKLRISGFDFLLFKKILFPSFTFMSFPIGNAIILQGFTLLINKFFGANNLVLYNTTRTMTNFVKTVMGAIATAVWPEFSIAYGKKDYVRMRKIHRYSLISSFGVSVLISVFLMVFGNYIYTVWTNGQIQFDVYLMAAFLVVLIINNIWYTSSVTLLATNNHSRLGILYVCSSFISILLAIILTNKWHSLILTVFCLLVIDATLSFYTLNKSMVLTRDSFYLIFQSILNKKNKKIY